MQPIEELYQESAKTVYRYLYSLTHDSSLAEELTQETFYQAIRCSDKFDESCKITTWLCAIAKNQLIVYRRKHPDTLEWEMTDKTVPSAEDDAIEKINRVECLKKLHDCPEPYREIMYLRLFGNLSFKEIGEILSKTENWARVMYYRGKERLRKEIENGGKA